MATAGSDEQLRASHACVAPGVWIGGDLAPLPAGVRTVVSLDAATVPLRRAGVVEHRHPFRDSRFQRVPRGPLEAAVAAVVGAPGGVLVRCRHGLNRSALVACLVLVEQGALAPPDAIAQVRRVRPGALNNPYFVALVVRDPAEPMG